MKTDFLIQKLLLFLSIALFSCSFGGKKQTSLIGEWKPVKASAYSVFNKTTSVYYYNKDSGGNRFGKNLDKIDSLKLVFKKDSTVFIANYGFILPTVPSWSFGDKVGGKWTQNTNKLKMAIGDDILNYPFFYKIIKLTNDSLILGMTVEDYGDVYMTMDFIR